MNLQVYKIPPDGEEKPDVTEFHKLNAIKNKFRLVLSTGITRSGDIFSFIIHRNTR